MQLLTLKSGRLALRLFFTMIIGMSGCTTDKDIKAQITEIAKSDVNFAGVTYTVDNKKVMLSGYCPSKKAKNAVEQTIKAIKVLNGVNDQIQIAPVTLDSSFTMKLAVDSVLSGYPAVTAEVNQSGVTLKGSVKKPELPKLLTGVKKLKPQRIESRLTVN